MDTKLILGPDAGLLIVSQLSPKSTYGVLKLLPDYFKSAVKMRCILAMFALKIVPKNLYFCKFSAFHPPNLCHLLNFCLI